MLLYCASKRRLFLLGLAFFAIMCISGIFALSNEVINNTESMVSTSAVDIEIKEFNVHNTPFTEDGKVVMPGDEIYLIPRINNLGIDCYLRAKITYTINNERYNELDYITGNYSSWVKRNDYYYYESVLSRNGNIDLFEKVTIPSNLTDEYQNKKIVVNIVVEAIQSKNFDGNWDEVEIKKSIDRNYDINYSGESTIIYENNADKYIESDGDFFGNLGSLLPGDSVSEKIKILNSSRNVIEFYFSLEQDTLSEDEKRLLNNINLVIKNNKGIIKETNLLDKETILLGIFDNNEGDDLTFQVSLPKELNNDYSKILTKVRWKFSLKDFIEDDIENPFTGDIKIEVSITIFLISSLGLLIIIILESKEIDNIEKENRKEV